MRAAAIQTARRMQVSPFARLRPFTAATVYENGQRCPSCLGTNWLIGRTTAECAHCGHASALNTTAGPMRFR